MSDLLKRPTFRSQRHVSDPQTQNPEHLLAKKDSSGDFDNFTHSSRERKSNPEDDVGPQVGEEFYRPGRSKWDSSGDFLMTAFGFLYSLEWLQGFPVQYLEHKLTFLLPMLVCKIVLGYPVLYLQFMVGQYVQEDSVSMWKVCRLFKGVGIGVVIGTYLLTPAYVSITSMSLTYLGGAIAFDPPFWTLCDQPWNTEDCSHFDLSIEHEERSGRTTAPEEFFAKAVGNLSEPAKIRGWPTPAVVGSLSFCISLIAVCVYFGLKQAVKIMWIGAVVPMICLFTIAFKAGITVGSLNGLKFLVSEPQTPFYDFRMWSQAAANVIFTYGLASGLTFIFARMNHFRHNIQRDTIIIIVGSTVFEFIAVFMMVSFVGIQGYKYRETTETAFNKTLEQHSFLFEVAADVTSSFSNRRTFARLFYAMTWLIGFNRSLYHCFAVSITVYRFTSARRTSIATEAFRWYHNIKSKFVSMIPLIGLSLLTFITLCKGGWVFGEFSINVEMKTGYLLLAAMLFFGISWAYGMNNLSSMHYVMFGTYPSLYLRICWKLSPILVLASAAFMNYQQLFSLKQPEGVLQYVVTMFPVFFACGHMVYAVCRDANAKGLSLKKRFLVLISLQSEHRKIKETGRAFRSRYRHWISLGSRQEVDAFNEIIAEEQLMY